MSPPLRYVATFPKNLFVHSKLSQDLRIFSRNFCYPAVGYRSLKKTSENDFLEEEEKQEREIEFIRNKSRLNPPHFNEMHGKPPFKKDFLPNTNPLKYKRQMYGRFGDVSGVDPAICFATKEEIEDTKEYEKVAFPYKIMEVRAAALKRMEEEKQAYWEREKEIEEQLAKQDEWKAKIKERLQLKLEEAEEAKAKREKLIEEVRRHFGYKVDPRDERFVQMLEQKEEEERKQKKRERKKKREEMFLLKLAAMEAGGKEQPEEKESED